MTKAEKIAEIRKGIADFIEDAKSGDDLCDYLFIDDTEWLCDELEKAQAVVNVVIAERDRLDREGRNEWEEADAWGAVQNALDVLEDKG